METHIQFILGSTSPHKLSALEEVCRQLGFNAVVSGIKAASGQNEMPVGFDETFAGALTRAKAAQEQNPGCVAVGIESGLFCFAKGKINLDIAFVVVLTPDGRQIVTTSEGIEFPVKLVKIAEVRGFDTTTVASVVSEVLGGDPTDPHAVLTNGKVTRKMTLVDALTTALLQL